MKSLKTLLLAGLSLMAFTTVYAQEEEELETDLTTLQFVDADGNVIADGATVNFAPTDPEETPLGFEIKPGIFVENLTDEPVYTAAQVNITAMSSGSLMRTAIISLSLKNLQPILQSLSRQRQSTVSIQNGMLRHMVLALLLSS